MKQSSAVLHSSLAALLLLTAGCKTSLSSEHRGSRDENVRRRESKIYKTDHVVDAGVIREINSMRADPPAYAAKLLQRRPYYRGGVLRLPNAPPLQTQEGVEALEEAVKALRETPRLPELAASDALARAARLHARDIGPKGLMEHTGSDGSSPRERIQKFARGFQLTAEVISFGPEQADSVVEELVIDDGVPGRGHRKILLNPRLRAGGSACGPHATFGTVCVADFTDTLAKNLD